MSIKTSFKTKLITFWPFITVTLQQNHYKALFITIKQKKKWKKLWTESSCSLEGSNKLIIFARPGKVPPAVNNINTDEAGIHTRLLHIFYLKTSQFCSTNLFQLVTHLTEAAYRKIFIIYTVTSFNDQLWCHSPSRRPQPAPPHFFFSISDEKWYFCNQHSASQPRRNNRWRGHDVTDVKPS